MSSTITHPDYNLIASVNNQYYSQDYLFICYEELKSTCHNVYKALRCNGLFVFTILL